RPDFGAGRFAKRPTPPQYGGSPNGPPRPREWGGPPGGSRSDERTQLAFTAARPLTGLRFDRRCASRFENPAGFEPWLTRPTDRTNVPRSPIRRRFSSTREAGPASS